LHQKCKEQRAGTLLFGKRVDISGVKDQRPIVSGRKSRRKEGKVFFLLFESSSSAEEAFAYDHNESIVWAIGTASVFVAV
jgi:hypothetical protein